MAWGKNCTNHYESYPYVLNNPMKYVDPLGLAPEQWKGKDLQNIAKYFKDLGIELVMWFKDGYGYDLIAPDWKEGYPRGQNYVTKEQLTQIFREFGHFQAGNVTNEMVRELNRVLHKYEINTPDRIKHFLAQVLVESRRGLTEKYNGTPEVYFKNVEGGEKYRGAGYIQITHKYNYQKLANYIGDQKIVELGYSYVAENYAWEAAGFWWYSNKMNNMVDSGATLKQISNAVNRGPGNANHPNFPNGWEDRKLAYDLVSRILK